MGQLASEELEKPSTVFDREQGAPTKLEIYEERVGICHCLLRAPVRIGKARQVPKRPTLEQLDGVWS